MQILELNDWQLSQRDEHGKIASSQPAAAASLQGQLIFGQAAVAQSRTNPQQFNNKYLYSLAADPVAGNLGAAQNHADLIYHHLADLNLPPQSSVAIGTASHVTNEQLGLMLGICQELGLNVAGFLDNALAYSLHCDVDTEYQVLDMEMHRAVVSRVQVNGAQRTVLDSKAIDGLGLANIMEGWMNVIADEFIHKTRFDPTHSGDSEQQVFDTITGWLGSSQLTEQRIRVNFDDGSRDLEIGPEALRAKVQQRLSALDLDASQTLAITPRAQQIPFLVQSLATIAPKLLPLNQENAAQGYLSLAEQLDPDNIRRITSGTSRSRPTQAAQTIEPIAPATQLPATHFLRNHIAYLPTHNIFVSESAFTNQTHAPGDVVTIGGQTYTAIRLE